MIKTMDKVFKSYTGEAKSSGEDRRLIVKISTSTPDRSNDVVIPQGVVLDNYLKNPVVALMHNYHDLPIAKAENVTIAEDSIYADVVFPDEGIHSVSDTVYKLIKGGFMNAWSIGFAPVESEPNADGGTTFKKWELWEFSAVLVPDNPEALTVLRSKGVDFSDVEKKSEAVDSVAGLEHQDEDALVEDVKEDEAGGEAAEDEAGEVQEPDGEADGANPEQEEEDEEENVTMSVLGAIREQLRIEDKNIGLFLKSLNETVKEFQKGGE